MKDFNNSINNSINNSMKNNDHIIRAAAADGTVRAFAATTRGLVEEARAIHGLSPVAAAALGRLMTAGCMMGTMLKDPKDLITLTIRGDGPLGTVTVTADRDGRVKGFVNHPDVWLPLRSPGHLDVGRAVGSGTLTVVRDQGMRDPYSSTIELVSGEIGEDLTAYFAYSDQVPSTVGLGVLVDTDLHIKQAGGFIVQLMPGVADETIDKLEKNLENITSVTEMFEDGLTPEQILWRLLGNLGLEILETRPAEFYCSCSKERTAQVLLMLGKKELRSMIADGEPVELVCHYCSKKYEFSLDELNGLLAEALVASLAGKKIIEIGPEAEDEAENDK